MKKNRLRELLDAGKPTLGTHLLSTWPTITELVGQTRQFDYIEFVAEYTPWTMHDLDNLGRAIELFPDFSGMIKIEQDMRGHSAMRAIGSGIQNVLFADVRTVEDARQCVRSVRAEHPDHSGRHGVGLRRDARTVLYVGAPDWVSALAGSVIALMIEKRQAVEDLDAILDVPGIDMVQFGPADYAMSMGLSRTEDAEQVLEAERHMIATALRRGIAPRAEIADAAGAEYYLNLGVRHFCVGHDVGILHNWFSEQGARMRSALGELGDSGAEGPRGDAVAEPISPRVAQAEREVPRAPY
ncbi:MAG: 2,4-dihydroxyhept-2-ene,7-dioic acid aldolase [Acidimicrobiaceae bacterium]|nr:2,4-dihydroxyhept-2-ene,7-dioic acid aldolase [Acidimicrobiaceae bacterium]